MNSIYILDFGEQIKIGKSKNPALRLKGIEKASGRSVKQHFSIQAHEQYEGLIHSRLSQFRGLGEYFNYPYEKAVSLLQDLIGKNIVVTHTSTIEQQIKSLLVKANITQTALAKKALPDLTNTYFNKKLKEGKFDHDELKKIAKALGAEYHYEEPPPQPPPRQWFTLNGKEI